ncbi:hypothetical protein (Partial), partial [Seminavis robusta]|eukprot:Sro3690_g350340.1 n/a (350) ;mRNA; f:4096-5146
MEVPDAESANNVMVKVLGEYNHVLIYAFADSENHTVKERLLFFLRQRYERLGGQSAIDKVIAGYDDLCCNNSDTADHFLPRIFPKCKRAFLKDVWHAVDVVKRETTGADHPLHDAFVRGLWNAILKWEFDSTSTALEHFRTFNPDGKKYRNRETAQEAMSKLSRYRDAIYNYISSNTSKMASDVWDLYQGTKDLDTKQKLQAQLNGEGYRPFFKKAIRNHQYGAEAAVQNLMDHIKKGCLSDPLQPREMSYRASNKYHSDEGPPLLRRRRGTNAVEIENRYGEDDATGGVSRQRSSLTHKKYLLHVSDHNLKCDRNTSHITGRAVRPRDWYIKEALQKDLTNLTTTMYND